jgi:aspartokinase-like uncharacterized kinase
MKSDGLTVVKVGGSLFDLPDLGLRLRAWLDCLRARPVLLVPGGGPTADVVRAWDRVHVLSEETAHWLALSALTLNARFMAELLKVRMVADGFALAAAEIAVLDAYAFACADEGQPGSLPASWDSSSDSVAARCAVVCGARRLVLLKSVTIPTGMAWGEAAEQGFVDRHFAATVSQGLEVQAVCLRSWKP